MPSLYTDGVKARANTDTQTTELIQRKWHEARTIHSYITTSFRMIFINLYTGWCFINTVVASTFYTAAATAAYISLSFT